MPVANPIAAFLFRVSFKTLPGDLNIDNNFVSVTGLKTSNLLYDDRGNPLTSPLLIRQPVVLLRHIDATKKSPLRTWVLAGLQKPGSAKLEELTIEILNGELQSAIAFKLQNVLPAAWELGELNAGKSELLVEEISFNYTGITQSLPVK
jgi:hypothetical protein